MKLKPRVLTILPTLHQLSPLLKPPQKMKMPLKNPHNPSTKLVDELLDQDPVKVGLTPSPQQERD